MRTPHLAGSSVLAVAFCLALAPGLAAQDPTPQDTTPRPMQADSAPAPTQMGQPAETVTPPADSMSNMNGMQSDSAAVTSPTVNDANNLNNPTNANPNSLTSPTEPSASVNPNANVNANPPTSNDAGMMNPNPTTPEAAAAPPTNDATMGVETNEVPARHMAVRKGG
jgi:hypothetical protein